MVSAIFPLVLLCVFAVVNGEPGSIRCQDAYYATAGEIDSLPSEKYIRLETGERFHPIRLHARPDKPGAPLAHAIQVFVCNQGNGEHDLKLTYRQDGYLVADRATAKWNTILHIQYLLLPSTPKGWLEDGTELLESGPKV